MLRRIPCANCRSGATGGADREPLYLASIPATGYQYRCSTCCRVDATGRRVGQPQQITLRQFLALPGLTPQQFAWEVANGELRAFPVFAEMVRSHYMD